LGYTKLTAAVGHDVFRSLLDRNGQKDCHSKLPSAETVFRVEPWRFRKGGVRPVVGKFSGLYQLSRSESRAKTRLHSETVEANKSINQCLIP
jgi:hypothetical protein